MRQGRAGSRRGAYDEAGHHRGQLELRPAGECWEPVWTVPSDAPEGEGDGDPSIP